MSTSATPRTDTSRKLPSDSPKAASATDADLDPALSQPPRHSDQLNHNHNRDPSSSSIFSLNTDEKQKKRVVLVAFDDSPNSHYMFQWAKDNIFRPELDHVLLMTVLDVNEPSSGNILQIVADRSSVDAAMESAHERLSALVTECRKMNVTADVVIVSDEDPKDAIVETASFRKAKLVLVGSRGLGKLKRYDVNKERESGIAGAGGTTVCPLGRYRALLGSVSDHVIRRCSCPVLVVQEREEKEKKRDSKSFRK